VAGFFMKIILTITFAFFLLTPISAQQFFRVKTDFSIKQKNADNPGHGSESTDDP
jgi:hypothetical protein